MDKEDYELIGFGLAAALLVTVGTYVTVRQLTKKPAVTSGPHPHPHHHHGGGGRGRGRWGGFGVYGLDAPTVIYAEPNVYYERVWDTQAQQWILVKKVL